MVVRGRGKRGREEGDVEDGREECLVTRRVLGGREDRGGKAWGGIIVICFICTLTPLRKSGGLQREEVFFLSLFLWMNGPLIESF